MPNTINDLSRMTERRLLAAQRRKAYAHASIEAIISQAEAEGRTHSTAAEQRQIDGFFADRDAASGEIADCERQLDSIQQAAADELHVARLQRQSYPVELPARQQSRQTASLSVGRNERTYRPDTDPAGVQFVLDVVRNHLRNDPVSSERLVRHMQEERVERPAYAGMMERVAGDTTTSNWAGLVVPAYLVDAYAPSIAALRPFADLCCQHVPLPPNGMTVNFSKLTTGTSAALQTSELSGLSATSADDTLGTANVQTVGRSQNISRQAIDRGTGIDQAIMQDLGRKLATALDSTLITQASTGLSAVAQTVTYTSASPTGPEFWPYLYQGASKLEAALLGVAYPSHAVMHSRRWNWLASNVASTWPIVGSASVPPQMSAQALPMPGGQAPFSLTSEFGPAVRAILASGLKVVVDNNVPTTTGGNQDEVYIVAANESMWLAEDPNAPVMIRAEQPLAASLGLVVVLYSYFAYFTRYANCASKIVGTGTAAPANF